ncbi:MAG: Nramp family divalent metal transporter [Acidobacteriaceae bacterium]|nr:Nramp family divalent metal transporter [Acidobacteriaceae bacterium]MBV9033598.1 Nramp family divalent metal transporter [Acidobacteriaceae bacterium]MBV9678079.1 Nramp family divalent metal transporter [Acidobacteriaceae bacterium]
MLQAAIRRRSIFALISSRLIAFLAVLGPGFITANVDNDPGGILTYSQAGAQFGYQLLWTLIPTTIALIVVQEMAARMGAITGKGLSDLIREEFGLRATFFTMIVLGLADFGNIISEFAGLASGMGIFGVSKYIVVPIGAALVWTLIVRGRYKPVERILIIASLVYFAYPVSAFLAKPNWDLALKQTFIPTFSTNPAYLVTIVGLIGTTITPWMQFYLQAAVVEKGVDQRHYNLCRLDVITGCIVTDVIAFFIVVACGATIYHSPHPEITDVAQAAVALKPFAGKFASLLFAVGLINASLLSAAILPLATSYNICEGLGFESGIDKRFSEAPIFYWLYTLLIGGGAAFVLIPGLPLLKFILFSQVANGILLPFVLVYMLLLVNRPRLMGSFKNKRWQNVIAWTTAVVMILLTAGLVYNSLVG